MKTLDNLFCLNYYNLNFNQDDCSIIIKQSIQIVIK
jgi:hypothetical protein